MACGARQDCITARGDASAEPGCAAHRAAPRRQQQHRRRLGGPQVRASPPRSASPKRADRPVPESRPRGLGAGRCAGGEAGTSSPQKKNQKKPTPKPEGAAENRGRPGRGAESVSGSGWIGGSCRGVPQLRGAGGARAAESQAAAETSPAAPPGRPRSLQGAAERPRVGVLPRAEAVFKSAAGACPGRGGLGGGAEGEGACAGAGAVVSAGELWVTAWVVAPGAGGRGGAWVPVPAHTPAPPACGLPHCQHPF